MTMITWIIMAESAENLPNLSELYKDLWDTYLFTENTNDASASPEYQVQIHSLIILAISILTYHDTGTCLKKKLPPYSFT